MYVFEFGKNRGRYLQPAFIIICGVVIFWFSNTNFFNIDRGNVDSGLYSQANYYLAKGDRDKAIALYHSLLDDNPSYPDANLNLGAAYMKKGMPDSAVIFFDRELALSPQNAGVFSNLASYYLLKDSLNRASTNADKAIDLKPYWADGYLAKLRILARQNEIEKIEPLLELARTNLGANPRLLLDAGLIYSQNKLYEKAQECLLEVLNLTPKAVESSDEAFVYSLEDYSLSRLKGQAAYQLGYIHGVNGNLDQSIEMSDLAISLDSNLVQAYVNLITGYLSIGERTKALQILSMADHRFPGNSILEKLSESIK